MMENRSFDHLLGWLPNADGRQGGLAYTDATGMEHDTFSLAPDFTGCGHPDPDHSYPGGRTEYNDGAMDGFLRSGRNDPYSIGYYTEDDRPFYNALALNYTTLDRSFCSILGPTFPNCLFLHAAQTDRLSNTVTPATLPTIWDKIAAAGVTGRYYFSNLPFLGLWGIKYPPISHTYKQFLSDAALGTLPLYRLWILALRRSTMALAMMTTLMPMMWNLCRRSGIGEAPLPPSREFAFACAR